MRGCTRSIASGEARIRVSQDFEADVEPLPFADGEFDTVICTHVLENVQDRERPVLTLDDSALERPPGDRIRAKGNGNGLEFAKDR